MCVELQFCAYIHRIAHLLNTRFVMLLLNAIIEWEENERGMIVHSGD